MQFFAMLARNRLWRKAGFGKRLKNFSLKVTPEQKPLMKTFYNMLLRGSNLDVEILAVAHRLLLSAFTLSLSSRNKVDSAFEQAMVFSIMTNQRGVYITPTAHTQLCAHAQRLIFTTFMNAAWHGGEEYDFKLDERAPKVKADQTNKTDTHGVTDVNEDEEVCALAQETEDVADGSEFPRFSEETRESPADDGSDSDSDDGCEDAGVRDDQGEKAGGDNGKDDSEGDDDGYEVLVRGHEDEILA